MQLKAFASTIALAAALAVSGPVAAQTMINGMTVPEDELPLVQQHCDDLQTAAGVASESTDQGDPAGQTDPGAEPVEEVEPGGMAQAVTPTIDLDTIDLQACIDAGLVTE